MPAGNMPGFGTGEVRMGAVVAGAPGGGWRVMNACLLGVQLAGGPASMRSQHGVPRLLLMTPRPHPSHALMQLQQAWPWGAAAAAPPMSGAGGNAMPGHAGGMGGQVGGMGGHVDGMGGMAAEVRGQQYPRSRCI